MPVLKQFTRNCLRAIAAAIIVVAPAKAFAQEVAMGSVTARVLANITVTAVAALDFSDIFQGVPKTVGNNEVAAAIFSIAGESGAGVSIYLQLPEYLALANGSDRMVITFGPNDASVDTTGAGDPTGMIGSRGWQNINPYSFPAATIVGSAGTDIYLGGRVLPSINQKVGDYSGDIIITATYNGT